jgi:hypothetical protein
MAAVLNGLTGILEKAPELKSMSEELQSGLIILEEMGSTVEKVVLGADYPVVGLNRLDVLEDYSAFRA